MQAQLELFGRRKARDVEEETNRLCLFLRNRGTWQTRTEIKAELGLDERMIRECGEMSNGQIIFGQLGMKHILCATPEEEQECVNTLYSVARRHMERAKAIERLYHKHGVGKEATA